MSVIAPASIRITFSPLRATLGDKKIDRRLGLCGQSGVLQSARSAARNLFGSGELQSDRGESVSGTFRQGQSRS
jgi:hypothetical protein